MEITNGSVGEDWDLDSQAREAFNVIKERFQLKGLFLSTP